MASKPLSKRVPSQGGLRFAHEVLETAGVIDDTTHEILLSAFATVPRNLFVEQAFNLRAAQDVSLPIGFGQTISRPSTVARMLGLVGIRQGLKVLEIGCGSGYCAAVMATAGATVFAVEYIGLLAQRTRKKLDAMNFHEIIIRTGDGRKGWKEHAPYDAIVVSAAFDQISEELLRQLKPDGGRLVAPIGSGNAQQLNLWETRGGTFKRYQLETCKFVEGQG